MSKKTTRILVAGLALLAVAAGIVWYVTRPQTAAGAKSITVTVVQADGSEKLHEIATDAEFLYDAVKDFVTGEDGDYGFFITGADGVSADESAQQWWALQNGQGEMLMTGVSETPIADGDAFRLVLTTGW